MKKNIILVFAAAALMMAAAVALAMYGQAIFEAQLAAAEEAEGSARFVISECYDAQLGPWEKASLLCGLLSAALTAAGTMLWDAESRAAWHYVLLPGPDAGAPQRVAAHFQPARDDEGLTPLERVIRGY